MSGRKKTDRADSNLNEFAVKDPEEFARNLARAVEAGGQALAAYLKPREEGKAPADAGSNAAS